MEFTGPHHILPTGAGC